MSALSGFRILELSEDVAGEYCGKLLADFGADVIKLEKPGEGSPTRRMSPFAAQGADPERSGLFAYLNTNKSSVALDLTTAEGKATLAKLLERVDAVIDDHPSGWLAEIGLDPEQIEAKWPKLVACSITAFGQNPPEERAHAEDLIVMQASGWGYHTPSGEDNSRPPLKGAGRFMVSYEAGLEAALCVAASLYDLAGDGAGRFIDISKFEVMAGRVDYVLAPMVAGEMDVSTSRRAFDLFGPAGIFPCRDGFIYIWLSAPAHWEGLRQLLGDPEWMNEFPERWLELHATPERVALCRHHIGEWLKTQDKDAAAEAAQKVGVTLVAVNNAADIKRSPQYQHRHYFAEIDHPAIGKALYPTVPYKLSETPAQPAASAPLLGQQTAQKLAALSEKKGA